MVVLRAAVFPAAVLAADLAVVLRAAVFFVVDLVPVFVDDLRVVLRRRLVGPAARFSASRRNASAGSMDSGVYCLGSVRFVSPSVMYAP